MGNLYGKVAVVTGASRGIGKGIALPGGTVYVTGRTIASGSGALPGTIGEPCSRWKDEGGKAIAVAIDLQNDTKIAALFELPLPDQVCQNGRL